MAEHLLTFFARQTGKPSFQFTEEARNALARYPWPGNVRELRNSIERGVILGSGPAIGLAELPAQIGATLPPLTLEVGGKVTLASSPTLDDAATTLGIDPSTLYRKRKKYGL
jgi:NtrC-family two-component system response regulator AlgB